MNLNAYDVYKIFKLLDYGFRLGIKTVTVYAFSIENFKRPVEEVDLLMSLAADKLRILSQKRYPH